MKRSRDSGGQSNVHDVIRNDSSVPKKARVTSIQFGLLSSEDIEKMSAVEVSDVVINKSGIVHKHGVNDSSMGTVIRSMLCSTCSCEMQACPGHTGHIRLNSPIINIEFITHVLKILTCVCFYCSKLLLPEDHPKYASVMAIQSKKKRQSEIHSYCTRFRTCGMYADHIRSKKEKNSDAEELDRFQTGEKIVNCELGCGGVQPLYVKDDIVIRAVFNLSYAQVEGIKAGEFEAQTLTPKKILQILDHISADDIRRLGMDPVHAHPSSMMWSNLIVPPVPMRPSRSKANNTKIGGEDDLTISLRSIVKANNIYGEGLLLNPDVQINLTRYMYKSVTYRTIQEVLTGHKKLIEPVNKKNVQFLYMELQRTVAGYQDSKYQSTMSEGSEYGRDRKSVRHRMAGQKAKKGRMRHTIFGKRQNYSSRTVITPCSNMDIDEVGVPKWICMKLTYPERVNQFNIHQLTTLVRNGPQVFPGANYAVDEKGKVISLKFIDRNKLQLKYGWIIRRHLKDGDDVLFNRQPSLHKMSLMAHRVKVMDGNSFRLHMAATKPYNADFDGDEMNLQVLLDELTRAEARELLSVKHNMVKDTIPLVCFQQHTIAAAYLMSRPGEWITKHNAFQLWYQNKYFELDHVPTDVTVRGGVEYFSGCQVFSACLPRSLYIRYGDLLIEKGQIKEGRLNKDTLNQGVLYTIWKDFGVDSACDFISGMQLLLEKYLDTEGLSVGVDDCYVEIPENLKNSVNTAMKYVESFQEHKPNHTGKSAEIIENNICLVLDKARDLVGDYVLEGMKGLADNRRKRNGLYEMINSGSKGNETNIVQVVGLVGQQRNHHSMRMSTVTSHFNSGTDKSQAHGMVCRSFFRGLRPCEYFNHLVGSRVGLVDTAVKTSETGYSQRRIAKAMEDLVVNLDKTVRDSNKEIVQYIYGDDGFDSASVEWNIIRLLQLSEEDVVVRYRCMPSTRTNQNRMDAVTAIRWQTEVKTYSSVWKDELKKLLSLRQRQVEIMVQGDEHTLKCLCPVAFERLLKRAQFEHGPQKTTDLTPGDVRQTMLKFWDNLLSENLLTPTAKIECLFWDWCSTKTLWATYGLDLRALRWFMAEVYHIFLTKSITPYESVGIMASQHCAEPLTQMTLNRFHKSGQFSHLVSGVARMKEIINVVKVPKTPSMAIIVKPGYDLEILAKDLIEVMADQVCESWQSHPVDVERNRLFRSSWKRWEESTETELKHLCIIMDRRESIKLGVSPRGLCNALRYCDYRKKMVEFDTIFSYSELESDVWWVSLNMKPDDSIWAISDAAILKHTNGCPADDDMVNMHIFEKLIKDCLVKGIRGLEDFYIGTKAYTEEVDGIPKKVNKNVIFTKGTNLVDLMDRKEVESRLVMTNHIREIEEVLGIDAACAAIEYEWRTVMTMNNAHVGMRHIKLISEAMCYRGIVCPMTYQGICRENSSIIKKASFEKAMDSFLWGAVQGQKDDINGCMDSVCWNGILKAGTGSVTLFSEPVNLPKSIAFKQDQLYARKHIAYQPPSKEELTHKFLEPKTKRRFSKKAEQITLMNVQVRFTPTNSVSFRPSSPTRPRKDRMDIEVQFSDGCFVPWTP